MARKKVTKAKKRMTQGMKRAAKTKARQKRRVSQKQTPPIPPTASNETGQIAQEQFHEAMLDEEIQQVQDILSKCKDMITDMYNRVVKMEVHINKLITMFTKDAMFSSTGVSKLDAISKLNAEKNKIYYFKKNVVSKLVADYVRASKESDSIEMLHSLNDFGDNYQDAMEEMQAIFDEADALRKELLPEEYDDVEEDTSDMEVEDKELDQIIYDNREELYKHGFGTEEYDHGEDPEER